MRIILTSEGKKVISELSKEKKIEKSQPNYFQTEYSRKSRNVPQIMTSSKQIPKMQTQSLKTNISNKTNNIITRNRSTISIDLLCPKPKVVNVNVKVLKVVFPKGGAEKYEVNPYQMKYQFAESKSSKMNQTEMSFPILNQVNSKITQSSNYKGKYSLKDILGTRTISQLKRRLIKDKKDKEEEKAHRGNIEYRSIYHSKSALVNFDEILSNNKIPVSKTNLINYLYLHKKQTNSILLKKISQSNPLQLNQLNKICQMSFSNKEKEKMYQDMRQNKIKEKENQIRTNYQNDLILMKTNMNDIKYTLDYYPNKSYLKECYKESYKDMKKTFWKKYHIDRLYKKTKEKPNENNEFD